MKSRLRAVFSLLFGFVVANERQEAGGWTRGGGERRLKSDKSDDAPRQPITIVVPKPGLQPRVLPTPAPVTPYPPTFAPIMPSEMPSAMPLDEQSRNGGGNVFPLLAYTALTSELIRSMDVLGYRIAFNTLLRSDSGVEGTVLGVCTLIDVKSFDYTCTLEWVDDGVGSLVTIGTVHMAAMSTQQKRISSTMAVVGGTGAYVGAQGSLTHTPIPNTDDYEISVTLI